jgi:hypothetical protein
MDVLNIEVNGLQLPLALVDAIRSGRWTVPSKSVLQAVFPSEPIEHPSFFGIDELKRENAGWPTEATAYYLGRENEKDAPGNIDPTKSVIIGDLGPDRLIALDFRASNDRPCVVYLTGNEESRWIKAAPDIESLLRILGL